MNRLLLKNLPIKSRTRKKPRKNQESIFFALVSRKKTKEYFWNSKSEPIIFLWRIRGSRGAHGLQATRELRRVKAGTHCEAAGCASAPSGYHSTFGYSLASPETESDLSQCRICVSSQTIRTLLVVWLRILTDPFLVQAQRHWPHNVANKRGGRNYAYTRFRFRCTGCIFRKKNTWSSVSR